MKSLLPLTPWDSLRAQLLQCCFFGLFIFLLSGLSQVYAQDNELMELERILASDHTGRAAFANAIAINGNTAVVGANEESNFDNGNGSVNIREAGAAYVFERDAAGNWNELQGIFPPNSSRSIRQQFGESVAISEDQIIVGAPGGVTSSGRSGAVYTFKRDALGVWSFDQLLFASDGQDKDRFGTAVAIVDGNAVVGAPAHPLDAQGHDTKMGAGKAYIFEQDGAGIWAEVQKIVSSDRTVSGVFGAALAMSDNYILIGAEGEGGDALGGSFLSKAGTAYIFNRDILGMWSVAQKLLPSDRGEIDFFGTSVAIHNNRLVIGSPRENIGAEIPDDNTYVGAAYVFEIDAAQQWTEVQKLEASDRGEGDYFGRSVTILENRVLVGALYDDQGAEDGQPDVFDAGSAYEFKRDATGTWNEINKIVASDRGVQYYFGRSVALTQNGAIIGAPNETDDEDLTDPILYVGAIYVYGEEAILPTPEIQLLGNDLVIEDGDTEPDVEDGTNFGTTTVPVTRTFTIDNTLGESELVLTGDPSQLVEIEESQDFSVTSQPSSSTIAAGSSVTFEITYTPRLSSTSEQTATVSIASNDTDKNPYTFTVSGTEGIEPIVEGFQEIDKVVASDRDSFGLFGQAVSVSGNVAVIGAANRNEDVGPNFFFDGGAAYVYERDLAGNWNETQKIDPLDRKSGAAFGQAVAISGDRIIVGAQSERFDENDANGLFKAGAVYIFERDITGTWVQVQKLVASDRIARAFFGYAVSIDGDRAIVGAVTDGNDAAGGNQIFQAGSAYVFERNTSGTWIERQKIVSSSRASSKYFGVSTAIFGNEIIVGAVGESTDATGSNPFVRSGSAHIFTVDSSGQWSETQKIVASDRERNAQFGFSVSISNDNILIGARFEDKDAQSTNGLINSGAAYLFKKDASGTWDEIQKLVAADRDDSDLFGSAVSISGDLLAIGAFTEGEDENNTNTLSNAGSVYIFARDASGVWNESQKVVASDRDNEDRYGGALALSGENLVIGASAEDEDVSGGNTLSKSGSAYFYGVLDGTSLSEVRDALETAVVRLKDVEISSTGFNEKSISLFPNPARNTLNIKNDSNMFIEKGVVYSVLGVALRQASITGGNQSIYTRNLPPGLYILHLTSKNGEVVRKQFIKE